MEIAAVAAQKQEFRGIVPEIKGDSLLLRFDRYGRSLTAVFELTPAQNSQGARAPVRTTFSRIGRGETDEFSEFDEEHFPMGHFPPVGCTTDSERTLEKVTVDDSFGPGMTFQNNGGWSLSGQSSDNKVDGKSWLAEQAFSFQGKAGSISDVWISLGYYAHDRKPGTITFTVDEDENGLPGRTLETWKVTEGFHPFDSTMAPFHLKGRGKTALLDNRTYWLHGTADDSSSVAWDMHPDPARTCRKTQLRANGVWDFPVLLLIAISHWDVDGL